MRRLGPLFFAVIVCSCGAHAPQSDKKTSPTAAPSPQEAGEKDDLFPEHLSGWATVEGDTLERINSLAKDYVEFASVNKTSRETTQALLERYRRAGAQALAGRAKAGDRLYWSADSGDAVALVQIGRRDFREGFRAIVASVDGGHLRLNPRPSFEKNGLVLWDTSLESMETHPTWLSQPLALHVHIRSRGKRGRSVVIGERPDEPVFSIPDLLPHLAGKAQRHAVIDSPKRLNAIAAKSLPRLQALLSARGLDEQSLLTSEAVLVPAGPALLIGVDRALIAATNHQSRALAFAATQAIATEVAEYTTIVLLVGQEEAGSSRREILPNVVAQVAEAAMGNADSFELRKVYARSAAILAGDAGGERNGGVVLNPSKDDALPAAIRGALNRLRSAGAAVQVSEQGGWSWAARTLSALDLDAVLLGVPISGQGAAYQLISTYDLFQAQLALIGWMKQ